MTVAEVAAETSEEALKTIWCTVWIIIMHFAVAPALCLASVFIYPQPEKAVGMWKRIHDIIPEADWSVSRRRYSAREIKMSLWPLQRLRKRIGIILINCIASNRVKNSDSIQFICFVARDFHVKFSFIYFWTAAFICYEIFGHFGH